MAPLLRALWARGFRSTSSCEGSGDGCAYIALWGGREAVSDLLATVPAADAAEVGADVLGAHGTVHFPRRFLSSWPAFLSAGAGDDR
jgi:hypothetical protein